MTTHDELIARLTDVAYELNMHGYEASAAAVNEGVDALGYEYDELIDYVDALRAKLDAAEAELVACSRMNRQQRIQLTAETARADKWEAEADKQFQYAGRVLEQACRSDERVKALEASNEALQQQTTSYLRQAREANDELQAIKAAPPVADVVKYLGFDKSIHNRVTQCSGDPYTVKHWPYRIKVVFDGETGAPKSADVFTASDSIVALKLQTRLTAAEKVIQNAENALSTRTPNHSGTIGERIVAINEQLAAAEARVKALVDAAGGVR